MSTPLPGTGLALSPASAFVTGAIVPIDGRVFGFQRCLEVLKRDSEEWRRTDETAHELLLARLRLATFLSGWK
jgi:hypothetical protein